MRAQLSVSQVIATRRWEGSSVTVSTCALVKLNNLSFLNRSQHLKMRFKQELRQSLSRTCSSKFTRVRPTSGSPSQRIPQRCLARPWLSLPKSSLRSRSLRVYGGGWIKLSWMTLISLRLTLQSIVKARSFLRKTSLYSNRCRSLSYKQSGRPSTVMKPILYRLIFFQIAQ